MICNDLRDDVIFEILSEINEFFYIFHVQIPHYLLLSSVYSSRLKVHHKTIIFHCSGYTLCFINHSIISLSHQNKLKLTFISELEIRM